MSGIYPAPWEIIGTLMDHNGEMLATIADANGNKVIDLLTEDLANRIVEAMNRAANEEPLSAKRERFRMEKNCFLLWERADRLEELLRMLALAVFKETAEEAPANDLAKEAWGYCNSIAPSDYADCIDYARHVLAKHEKERLEKVCGVDLGTGPSETWIAEVTGPDGKVRRWKITPEGAGK